MTNLIEEPYYKHIPDNDSPEKHPEVTMIIRVFNKRRSPSWICYAAAVDPAKEGLALSNPTGIVGMA